jgi:hypothetical protein
MNKQEETHKHQMMKTRKNHQMFKFHQHHEGETQLNHLMDWREHKLRKHYILYSSQKRHTIQKNPQLAIFNVKYMILKILNRRLETTWQVPNNN